MKNQNTNPDKIELYIPPQQYDTSKYLDNKKCYLGEALLKAGFKNVFVSEHGHTGIGEDRYLPEDRFDGDRLKENFKEGKGLNVTLIKQNKI